MKRVISNTAIEDRRKKVNEALAINLLGTVDPTPQTQDLAQQYIDGKIPIEEMRRIILQNYCN